VCVCVQVSEVTCSTGAVRTFVAMIFVFTIFVQQRYLFLYEYCSTIVA
jgi:hypothetical protein